MFSWIDTSYTIHNVQFNKNIRTVFQKVKNEARQ